MALYTLTPLRAGDETAPMKHVLIIGISGAIGRAMADHIGVRHPDCLIVGASRQKPDDYPDHWQHQRFDLEDEASLEKLAKSLNAEFDLIFVATGFLHNNTIKPEKSLRDLSFDHMQHVFALNVIGPSLCIKHLSPLMNTSTKSVFALLSARVGSISDNRLGGWYSYRASKAALNMMIKSAAIEINRRFKSKIIAGLHPGTVDSDLSKPFQGGVPQGQLFTAQHSAKNLLNVIENLASDQSGKCFDWQGKEIVP